MKAVNATEIMRDDFKAQIDNFPIQRCHKVNYRWLEDVDGRVGTLARRRSGFFMKFDDDAIVVLLDDAAGFRGIGIETHHRDLDTHRTVGVRTNEFLYVESR